MSNYRVYTPDVRWGGNPVDMAKCRKRMYRDNYGASQCTRRAVVEEEGYGWCKQHAPSAAKARQDATKARHAAGWEHAYRLRVRAQLEQDIVTAAMNWGDNGKGEGPLMEAYQALRKHLTEPE